MKVAVDAAARIAGGEADDAARKLSPWIYVGVCVLAALAFALFSLTGYVESKLAESGERQALALTQVGSWYVCEVMPVDVVRSEVDVVSAIFAFVFLLSVLCVILAGAVAAYLYRKRAHEREVEMKTHLYAALSDSLDLSVFLFSPADGEVTAVVAEGASCGIGFAELFHPSSAMDALALSDDGIGMSEDYLEHLFEPFVIEGRSRSQGTGLGMSIVRSIVTAAGGDIHVETKLGEDTTFTIVMNRRVAPGGDGDLSSAGDRPRSANVDADGAVAGAVDGAAGAVGAVAGGGAGAAGGRLALCAPSGVPGAAPRRLDAHVLLAEDNELSAEIARELLGERGVKVDWARDGAAALELLKAKGADVYDAVLMDVRMPVMNGYEATRAIRALDDPVVRGVPVVAMSANAFADDVLASLKSGMNAHLSKPIDIDEVIATLAREISARKAGV